MFSGTTREISALVERKADQNLTSEGYLGNPIAQTFYQIHLGIMFSYPSHLIQSTEHSLVIREMFRRFDEAFVHLQRDFRKRIAAAIKREVSTIEMKVEALRTKFKDDIDYGAASMGATTGCLVGGAIGGIGACTLFGPASIAAPLICATGAPIAGAVIGSKMTKVNDYEAGETRAQIEARLDHSEINKEVDTIVRDYVYFLMDRLADVQDSLREYQAKLESGSINIDECEKEIAPLKELNNKYKEFFVVLKSWTGTCDQIKVIAGRIWHQHIRQERWGLYDPTELQTS